MTRDFVIETDLEQPAWRITSDKKKVLEVGFPDHVPFRVKYDEDQFEDLTATIFLFKKEKENVRISVNSSIKTVPIN